MTNQSPSASFEEPRSEGSLLFAPLIEALQQPGQERADNPVSSRLNIDSAGIIGTIFLDQCQVVLKITVVIGQDITSLL
jgi:hypothetical protein